MSTVKVTEVQKERLVTVKITYNSTSKSFFIDFWDKEKYLVSEKIPENHAIALAKHLEILIPID